MHFTTYYPRVIQSGGKRFEIAPGLSGSIGNIAACQQYVAELRARLAIECPSFIVRRYCTNYVTFRPTNNTNNQLRHACR